MTQATALRAAVFDIDGTLLDSNYHHTVAWSRAFAWADRSVALWRIHRSLGMGGDRLVAAVAGDAVEAADGDSIRARWEQEYDEIIHETRLFDGARDLLEAVRGLGLRVALASSAIPKHAEHAGRLLGADDLADVATTAEDTQESKPDPELVTTALERLDTSDAVMIGDAVWDVLAATDAGIPTIGLLAGGYGGDELLEAGAVAVFDDVRDLAGNLADALARCADWTRP